ncbi:hydrogenase 4 membrane subunit [Escherichia coli]|uniref:Hydrogenase 4 membrane subunit n=1 Tax=Escherichia coli TaxID=562 RepID=A0A377D0K1_ECOLX|nr:hydrogenase 4 membrane subunit [Escherichia coli]
MENLALTTLMLPFIGALVVSFSPQRRAAEWGVLFAALTTLCMLSLISAFYQADKSCRHVDVGQRGGCGVVWPGH